MKTIANKVITSVVDSAVDKALRAGEEREHIPDTLPERSTLGCAAPAFECDALLSDRSVGKIRSCDFYTTTTTLAPSTVPAAGGSSSSEQQSWVLLLFFPADFSFVCATELLALSELAERFKRECNCRVMACSTDTVYAHRAWCSLPRARGGLSLNDGVERHFEQPLGFPLLSDVSRNLSKDFGVLFPPGSEHAGMSMSATFLIAPNGLVRYSAVQEIAIARSIPELFRLTHAYIRHAATGELLPHGWKIGARGISTTAMIEVGPQSADSIDKSQLHQQAVEAAEQSAASSKKAQQGGIFSQVSHALFGGGMSGDAEAHQLDAEVRGTAARAAIAERRADDERLKKEGKNAPKAGSFDEANRIKQGTQTHNMISSLDLKHTPNLAPPPKPQLKSNDNTNNKELEKKATAAAAAAAAATLNQHDQQHQQLRVGSAGPVPAFTSAQVVINTASAAPNKNTITSLQQKKPPLAEGMHPPNTTPFASNTSDGVSSPTPLLAKPTNNNKQQPATAAATVNPFGETGSQNKTSVIMSPPHPRPAEEEVERAAKLPAEHVAPITKIEFLRKPSNINAGPGDDHYGNSSPDISSRTSPVPGLTEELDVALVDTSSKAEKKKIPGVTQIKSSAAPVNEFRSSHPAPAAAVAGGGGNHPSVLPKQQLPLKSQMSDFGTTGAAANLRATVETNPTAFGAQKQQQQLLATQQGQRVVPQQQQAKDPKAYDLGVEVWRSGSETYGQHEPGSRPNHEDNAGSRQQQFQQHAEHVVAPAAPVAAMSKNPAVFAEIDRHTHRA